MQPFNPDTAGAAVILAAALVLTPLGRPAQAEPAPPLLRGDQVGAQRTVDLTFARSRATGTLHVFPSADPSARPIAAALQRVQPGQNVVVHGGHYRERLTSTRSGEPTRPIRLVEAHGEKVVLEGAGDGPFLRLQHPYWVVRGFEIDATGSAVHAVRVDHTHHVLVEAIDAHSGTGPAAVALFGARDTVLRDSTMHDYTNAGEDSHGALVYGDSSNVVISGNNSWGNTGDSVQCAGVRETGLGTTDPTDVTIVNNRFGNLHPDKTPRAADQENAVDIKTCTGVTVRGNKLMGFRSSPRSGLGTALVVHYGADRVLIEQNRIWDSQRAASLGSEVNTGLGSVVFRRNAVFDLAQVADEPGGPLRDAEGVRLAPARVAEVYNNTFYRIPAAAEPTSRNYAVRVGREAAVGRTVVINNVIDGTGSGIEVPATGDVTVARNLLWRTAQGIPAGSIVADPLWRGDPVRDDFFTRDASPARDVGLRTGAGVCGSGLDIGFLETCTPDSGR